MKKVLVVQPVASYLSRFRVVDRSFRTCYNKIGLTPDNFDWDLYVDRRAVGPMVDNVCRQIAEAHKNVRYIPHLGSWALDVNKSMAESIDKYEYIVLLHDDMFMETDNWINVMHEQTKNITNLGVVTVTDTVYRTICSFFPIARECYHRDSYAGLWGENRTFQFHNFPKRWSAEKLYSQWTTDLEKQLDYPNAPVKIFSSWSMFMAMRTSILKTGMNFENWCSWTFLNEQDFNMQCMINGLYNCYVPNIYYEHWRDLSFPQTRSADQIVATRKEVHAAFRKKWGFGHDIVKEEKQLVLDRAKGNLMEEFVGTCNTFDWKYW